MSLNFDPACYDPDIAEAEFDTHIIDVNLGHAINDVGRAAVIFSLAIKEMGTLTALKSAVTALNILSFLR